MSKQRILVAMSGGVDSAVAAALLHREGYDVVGVTLRLYTEADDTALRSRRTCCGVEDVAAAQRIGIPHYVLNMECEFERDVHTTPATRVWMSTRARVSGPTPGRTTRSVAQSPRGPLTSALDLDGHDVDVVVLAMLHGGRVVA